MSYSKSFKEVLIVRVLKQDKRYTIEEGTGNWHKVFFNTKILAHVIDIETARQVIYKEIANCDYLNDSDFDKHEKETV
mgnify:CR=1 FL=1